MVDKYLMSNAELTRFCRNYMELKKDLPIRPSEMGVLNIITKTEGPHTSVRLAELLGVSKPMITAHLSVLIKKGYVTKQQSGEDKRVFYISPTEKAKELVIVEKEKADKLLDLLVNEMGESEFEHLVSLVTRVNRCLETEIRKLD